MRLARFARTWRDLIYLSPYWRSCDGTHALVWRGTKLVLQRILLICYYVEQRTSCVKHDSLIGSHVLLYAKEEQAFDIIILSGIEVSDSFAHVLSIDDTCSLKLIIVRYGKTDEHVSEMRRDFRSLWYTCLATSQSSSESSQNIDPSQAWLHQSHHALIVCEVGIRIWACWTPEL